MYTPSNVRTTQVDAITMAAEGGETARHASLIARDAGTVRMAWAESRGGAALAGEAGARLASTVAGESVRHK